MKSSLGIIGNVGVDGTADFLKAVVKELDQNGVKILPRIIVEGVEVNRADEEALLQSEVTEPFKQPLLRSALHLAEANADIIVLACNTLHVLQDEIRAVLTGTRSQFLTLTEAVAEHLVQEGIQRIGIVGTSVTSGLFTQILKEKGIELVQPNDETQKNLNASIRRIVTNNVNSDEIVHTQNTINDIHNQGAEAFLMACTDLSHFEVESHSMHQLDSTQILARKAVMQLLKMDT